MRPRRLVPLVLLALVLAGCAEPAAEGALGASASPGPQAPEGAWVPDAMGPAGHAHDAWAGRDRLTVIDETRPVSPLFLAEHWDIVFVPPEGVVVPQGARTVEARFDWSDPPLKSYSEPDLYVKTAADASPRRVGSLAPGAPLVFEVSANDSDLPHQRISAWEFRFRFYPEVGDRLIAYMGELTLRVDVERGYDVPLLPPHPDPLEGKDEIVLFKDSVREFGFLGRSDSSPICLRACPMPHTPDDGVIVPASAAIVEVTLELPKDVHTRLGLMYHGADTRNWTTAKAEGEGERRVFRIPVGEGADSPYAHQSQWAFLVYAEEPVPHGAHHGAYTLAARALREG